MEGAVPIGLGNGGVVGEEDGMLETVLNRPDDRVDLEGEGVSLKGKGGVGLPFFLHDHCILHGETTILPLFFYLSYKVVLVFFFYKVGLVLL